MSFTIVAELPLGTYRASTADRQPEALPPVSRLYSALLCAAGFGPRAVVDGDTLRPSDADEALLRWLEANPPDEISVPAIRVNRGSATAYRDDGTLGKRKSTVIVNKLPKPANACVAVDGKIAWTWESEPPQEIATALESLCPDVPYLGTSESPVRLSVSRDDAPPSTHRRDAEASVFSGPGRDVELVVRGRFEELSTAHMVATGKPPTAARDRYGTNERSESPIPPRGAVAPARYVSLAPTIDDVPWPTVFVMPLRQPIAERDKVRWAVAAHQAIISVLRDDAPSLVTGVYPKGVRKPRNRLALHLVDVAALDDDIREHVQLEADCVAVLAALVPHGAQADDIAELARALRNLPNIRSAGRRLFLGQAHSVSGAHFWREPEAGHIRLWRTNPAAIPDSRGDSSNWTFGHAALLSLGFVWHGSTQLLQQPGHGDARNRAIVEAAIDAGAVVLSATPLRTASVHDYVHKVNEHAVVRPYHALLSVGSLGTTQSIQAIGQSRHLGGGLLVPVDVPSGMELDRASLARVARTGSPSWD